MTQQKVAFANSLRGVAALLVLVAHYAGVFWFARNAVSGLTGLPAVPASVVSPSLASWVTLSVIPFNLGPLGVALFFLISGFVIPFAFQRQSRQQFLIGRIFRIWPVYFVCFAVGIVALFAASLLFGTELPFNASSALLHSIVGLREIAGSPHIDGILWTLEIEVKFYLLAFLIAPLFAAGSTLSFCVPAAIFLACTAAAPMMPAAVLFSAPYLIFMFIGVTLNFLYRNKLGLGATCCVSASLAAMSYHVAGAQAVVAINYALALVIFTVAMATSRFAPDLKILRFLADISYPLYAVHGLAGYALMTSLLHFGLAPWIALIIAAATAIGLAWAIHSTLEVWSINFGRRVFNPQPRLAMSA